MLKQELRAFIQELWNVKQFNSKKIDIYISVHLKHIDSSYHGKILVGVVGTMYLILIE